MSKKGVLFLQIRGVLPLGKVHLGHFGGSAVDPGVAAMKETGSVLVGDFHASVSRECTIIGCASPWVANRHKTCPCYFVVLIKESIYEYCC